MKTVPNWYTVTCFTDTGNAETGPCPDSWEHPFNYATMKEAYESAVRYYSEMPEVAITYIRPSTLQEVIEFLEECYGEHESPDDLPF